jgi:beta-glucanase (GH16 family)
LWPLTNKWPPEIDFSETGDKVTGTTASVHFGAKNTIVHRSVTTNMRLWHTWGVIWTRSSITYTLDGRVWGVFTVARDIPRVRMTLDVEQVTNCPLNRDCPTAHENMYVDWVAEYTK